MTDTAGYFVVPTALTQFGSRAAGHAAGFLGEATALEALTLPADAFGTIRSSPVIAAAAANSLRRNSSSVRHAAQGAGFFAEAVPAAGRSYVAADDSVTTSLRALGRGEIDIRMPGGQSATDLLGPGSAGR